MIDTIHHRKLIADGALLLDVRTPSEFSEQHLPRALNVPVQDLPHRLNELGPTTRPIVVYCRSGGRSAQATAVLRQAGYREGPRPDDCVVSALGERE